MPTDGATAKFLYIILKQLDLKSIDWQTVATQLSITNGHAARMRFSRFKQHMEGVVPAPRSRRNTPSSSSTTTAPTSRSRKAKVKNEKGGLGAGGKKRGFDEIDGGGGDGDGDDAEPGAEIERGVGGVGGMRRVKEEERGGEGGNGRLDTISSSTISAPAFDARSTPVNPAAAIDQMTNMSLTSFLQPPPPRPLSSSSHVVKTEPGTMQEGLCNNGLSLLGGNGHPSMSVGVDMDVGIAGDGKRDVVVKVEPSWEEE
ncbi:MAG: hypothetical protein M1827_003497 [Pycnora praestabilis]|nr:MAG: hypothetical protein M1827_003497 [Pycnora praestabilis]